MTSKPQRTTTRAAKVIRISREEQTYWRTRICVLNNIAKDKKPNDHVTATAGTLQEIADELERIML